MGKTLLLADDSVTIQKVVGISFASEDIAITTVDNGDDAIARAREMRPDVILADVVMPGKSGYEVCETIKADPDLRHIPVLLLTGTFEAFDEERANRAGAAGQIAKPFEAQTLVERVKQLLASAPAAAASAAPAAPQQSATPRSGGASAGGDSAFDFFDEQPSSKAAGDARADFEIDEPDAAFAFGDDDIAGPTNAPPLPQKPAPAAHTVAILPEDPPAPEALPLPPPPAEAPVEPAQPAASAPGEMPPVGPPRSQPAPPPPLPEARRAPVTRQAPPPPAADEAFDFDFESAAASPPTPAPPAAPTPAPAPAASPPVEPEAESLSESMLMDPAGDSAFDVSSSELGDLVVPEPEPEAIEATQLMDAPPELEPDPVEAEPIAVADDVADAVDPADLAPRAPGRDARGGADAQTAPPAFDPAPVGVPIPDEALAQIAPALREQLHETLEKIAWEAFGQVTETVVEQAVERLEKIAWEVVPKLAETLIQEEIRKLKGQ